MPQNFFSEFNQLNFVQKILLIVMTLALLGYGLLHGGLLKLPAARAYDCGKVSNAKIIKIQMQNGKFSPAAVTATVCDRLLFINRDSQPRWPAVGPHPTHTSYPGFDSLRGLKQGEEFEFLLNRSGHYTFHDHLEEAMIGTIAIIPPQQAQK